MNMYDLIMEHQSNIMLFLCAVSSAMAGLLFITRFLTRRRKWILIGMEIIATLLLYFDRLGFLYSGNTTMTGYVIVRVANFMVFLLTSGIVFCFNLYLADLLMVAGVKVMPKRLTIVGFASIMGMILSVVSVFTGLYYSFDEFNVYHRGPGFLICYVVPVLGPLIQFTVILRMRRCFNRFIYSALCLYIFVPIIIGIIQIFAYGLCIVNMAMVLVSVSLYIFTYIDINDEVQRTHRREMQALEDEKKTMKNLFSQTARTFVTAVEKRNEYWKGKSLKTAQLAKKIALKSGKTEDESDEVYYAALLHNSGIAAFPDSVLVQTDFTSENEVTRKLSEVSSELLSNINEYPYLSEAALCVHERFDGKGFPRRLKGEDIPEISRIISVAESYVTLTSRTVGRNALPPAVVREEFIKEAGSKFDPKFSAIMVQLMDAVAEGQSGEDENFLESQFSCSVYREKVSAGIPVTENTVRITFKSAPLGTESNFSAPSLVLFDSFDRRVHRNQKSIEDFKYCEYGELWFDGHTVSTNARNMEVRITECEASGEPSVYTVTAARFEDHIQVEMQNGTKLVKVIVALPDISKAAYIGLTGENCFLSQIAAEQTQNRIDRNDIPRIAEEISFINRIESDVPNIQINSNHACYTEGIEIKEKTAVIFHTMSFPESSFVWNCPHIVIFSSKDGNVGGPGYCEYAVIKLNGEDNGSNVHAENSFLMKKNSVFTDWNEWKKLNRSGFECEINLERHGNSIRLRTENLGISIENTSVIRNAPDRIYAALTGDQCALTDIRVV